MNRKLIIPCLLKGLNILEQIAHTCCCIGIEDPVKRKQNIVHCHWCTVIKKHIASDLINICKVIFLFPAFGKVGKKLSTVIGKLEQGIIAAIAGKSCSC